MEDRSDGLDGKGQGNGGGYADYDIDEVADEGRCGDLKRVARGLPVLFDKGEEVGNNLHALDFCLAINLMV